LPLCFGYYFINSSILTPDALAILTGAFWDNYTKYLKIKQKTKKARLWPACFTKQREKFNFALKPILSEVEQAGLASHSANSTDKLYGRVKPFFS